MAARRRAILFVCSFGLMLACGDSDDNEGSSGTGGAAGSGGAKGGSGGASGASGSAGISGAGGSGATSGSGGSTSGSGGTSGSAGAGGSTAGSGGTGGTSLSEQDCAEPQVLCVDADAAASTSEFSTIQAAVDETVAGDTVLVFPGSYAGFRVDHSGDSGEPIAIVAASSGVEITSPEAQSHNFVRIQASSYITVQGFRIVGAGTPQPYDYDYACVAARGVPPETPMLGLAFIDNEIVGCSPAGMYLSNSEGVVVEGNHIHDGVHDANDSNGQAIYLANAGTKYAVVRGNRFLDNAGPGIHYNGDLSCGGDGIQTGHILVNNIVARNGQNGFNMDGVQGSLIANNVFADNARYGIRDYQIDAAAGPSDMIVVNNTFVGNLGGALRFTANGGGHVLFNNLLVGNAEGNQLDLDGDTAEEAANLSLDDGSAVFVDAAGGDYHLVAGCSAVDAGVSSLAGHDAPAGDLEGQLRSAPPDVGAFEWVP